jgi:hypothetical protein
MFGAEVGYAYGSIVPLPIDLSRVVRRLDVSVLVVHAIHWLGNLDAGFLVESLLPLPRVLHG